MPFYRGHMKSNAEAGTIVGPNAHAELLVARPCEHDEAGKMDFWTVGPEDIRLAKLQDSPRSLTEVALRKGL